jgi:hypothetical protein
VSQPRRCDTVEPRLVGDTALALSVGPGSGVSDLPSGIAVERGGNGLRQHRSNRGDSSGARPASSLPRRAGRRYSEASKEPPFDDLAIIEKDRLR